MSPDFPENSNAGINRKELQSNYQDVSNSISYTLDLSTSTDGNSTALSDQELQIGTSKILNPAKDYFLNNILSQKRENLSYISNQKIIQYDSVLTRQNTLKHNDLSVPLFTHTDTIKSQDISIEESKSKITVRFLIKKSKRFCGAIRFYLSKSVTSNNSKFKNLISSLKSSVISSLSSNAPSSKTLKKITNKLISTLKVHHLPECMHFRGFSFSPIHKRKKHKDCDVNTILQMYSRSARKNNNGTFINPMKTPDLQDSEGFQFAKPKMYECGYCQLRFYKIPVYLKHIRRHREIIRCVTCDRAFLSVISKRRHQLQCRKKSFY